MTRGLLRVLVLLALSPGTAAPAGLEIGHPATGHDEALSAPAIVALADGTPLVAWIAAGPGGLHVLTARAGEGAAPARVDPDGIAPDTAHQPPGLAVGPGGEVYVTWSSTKPKPAGTFFASDLRLSRSLDGGRRFDHHLRVNEDRPIAHGFEGIDVAADGTVIVAWLDGREGGENAGTYVVRVAERGTRVAATVRLDAETCVCCRADVGAGGGGRVAVAWRRVFPGNVRDMVLAVSDDAGRSFGAPALVHDDGWRITACPHRGGSTAVDRRGRIHVAWYTEGPEERPAIYFTRSRDGARFTPPVRLDVPAGAIPDHLRLAVNSRGQIAVVWQESTAVRRRVMLRTSRDGGRTFDPPRSLSEAIKAYAPDVAPAGEGTFLVAWHEERFPATVTVVQPVHLSSPVVSATSHHSTMSR